MRLMVMLMTFLLLTATTTVVKAAEDWQMRAVCDLRRHNGDDRARECQDLVRELLLMLPEKAGSDKIAVISMFEDHLAQAKLGWDTPCPDPGHCPDHAYTLGYAFVAKSKLDLSPDKTYTVYICRDNFTDTPQDASVCQAKLIKVMLELSARAAKNNAFLALLKCAAQVPGPDMGPAGGGSFELIYAFVSLPDNKPIAGDNAREAARQAVGALTQQAPQTSKASSPALAGPANPGSAGQVVMRVGAYQSLVQAEQVADKLRSQGVEADFEPAWAEGREVYRVLAKAWGDAGTFKQHLRELGYPGAVAPKN